MTVSSLSLNRSAERLLSSFARRSFLPLRQDSLWKIEKGVVRTLTVSEDGISIILGLWGPGDIVGKALCTANPYQIECLTSVQATHLPAHSWYQATEAMVLHIQRYGELVEILHCRQAEASILRLFTWLGKRFGQQVEQGQLIDLRLTHQDIGDLLGITRVTVTRLLNDFEKQGIIQRKERQFILMHDQSPFWHYEI